MVVNECKYKSSIIAVSGAKDVIQLVLQHKRCIVLDYTKEVDCLIFHAFFSCANHRRKFFYGVFFYRVKCTIFGSYLKH